MDKSFLQSLSVVLAALAFLGVCWWAFAPSRRKQFNEAANLPFADEPNLKTNQSAMQRSAPEGKQG